MLDVLIAGAGPAGAIAGLVLARAGVRVRLLDRASFPRDKLCGDTLNPGTIALLDGLGVTAGIRARALPVDGMLVTGTRGVAVRGRYPQGAQGLALVRRDLDSLLLAAAIDAGAEFENGVTVRGALVSHASGPVVTGLKIDRTDGRTHDERARLVIAADGRHSSLAFSLGLAAHPARPRRWAVGAYYADVAGLSTCGEMHIRARHYVGIAPVPGGLTNVCLVSDFAGRAAEFRNPACLIQSALDADPDLRARFAGARSVSPPVVLGPLAVDTRGAGMNGLLLAGDSAGFIDPMTGDGLRFAVQGAQLAAAAALRALESGSSDAHTALARARTETFSRKYRFNRTLRRLVSAPACVGLAGQASRVAPSIVKALIAYAGDTSLRVGDRA